MKAEFCNEIIQGLKEPVDALYFLNYGEIQLKFEGRKYKNYHVKVNDPF